MTPGQTGRGNEAAPTDPWFPSFGISHQGSQPEEPPVEAPSAHLSLPSYGQSGHRSAMSAVEILRDMHLDVQKRDLVMSSKRPQPHIFRMTTDRQRHRYTDSCQSAVSYPHRVDHDVLIRQLCTLVLVMVACGQVRPDSQGSWKPSTGPTRPKSVTICQRLRNCSTSNGLNVTGCLFCSC